MTSFVCMCSTGCEENLHVKCTVHSQWYLLSHAAKNRLPTKSSRFLFHHDPRFLSNCKTAEKEQLKTMKRWSLHGLANLRIKSSTAETILQQVADRLAWQQAHLGGNASHLQYLHRDTERLCRQLLSSPSQIIQRWTPADQNLISKTLEQIRDRHAASFERFVDLETTSQSDKEDLLRVRYSIQLMCDHYVKLYKNDGVGAVTSIENASDLLDPAISQAQQVCESHWMISPEVQIEQTGEMHEAPITIVQPWVHHALVELIKNAFHSTLKRQPSDPPPLQVTISCQKDENTVCMEIRDFGIGLPSETNSTKPNLFELGYSSAAKRWDRLDEQQSYAAVRSPMSSLGVGLPVSRLMMQHFGGSVTLESPRDETGGAVARILLPRRDDVLEQIPIN